jgi:peptidoglycan/LPS O-acetylase OafA/YrhL
MLFQYALLFGITRLYVKTGVRRLALVSVFFPICLFWQAMFVIIGVGQGYLLMMLMSGVFAFLFGDRILSVMVKYANRRMLAFVAAVCLMGILGLVWGWGKLNQTMYYWLCMVVAISVVCGALLAIKTDRCNPIVMYVSAISYEIYLVHYPLCSGSPIFLRKILHNGWVYSVMFILGTLIGGMLLSRLFNIINGWFECKNGPVHQKVIK